MKYLIHIVFLLITGISAQGQFIQNGTLLGPIGAQPPDYWYSCNEWADPDIMNAFAPINGDPVIYPTDGSTLLLMRARGVNYAGRHPIRSREYMSQELQSPLLQYNCYTFTADLCYSPYVSINDNVEPNVSYPLTLEIWGAHENCRTTTLLYESEPIDNTQWEEYTFNFTVTDDTYSHLFIQVGWDTVNIKDEAYNGIVLLDNLYLEWSGASDTVAIHDVYYYADRDVILNAEDGLSYRWDGCDYLSSDDIQSPTVEEYHEQFNVIITRESGCPVTEIFNLIIDCDSLYLERDSSFYTIYYKYEPEVYLTAKEGMTYDWLPEVNLSGYHIRTPYMTDYHDSYTVLVYDKYGCTTEEEFIVILECDSLYPENNLVALDTSINSESPVQLRPMYGEISGSWNPSIYLSCTDCNNPVATPENSTTYSAVFTDRFSCEHTEIFAIEVNLRIPNVITPNRDGFNEFFEIYGLPEGSTLTIFDKSGRTVFTVSPYGNHNWWRGTDNKGDPVDSGTYWYAIELGDTGEVIRGFIFVKR